MTKPISMLQIDDRAITTDLDKAGYRKMGVLVKTASSYDEATRLLGENAIDIVVINMDFPKVNAVEATRHLKASKEWREIPVVVTSVQTAAKIRSQALEAGADLFVEQPLPRQYFIEKLKSLLDQQIRSTERISAAIDITMKVDGREFQAPLADLSISGLLVETSETLSQGVTVDVTIPLSTKKITARGEVVRRVEASNKPGGAPRGGLGIRFVSFHGDSKERLEAYLAKQADHGRMVYYL